MCMAVQNSSNSDDFTELCLVKESGPQSKHDSDSDIVTYM